MILKTYTSKTNVSVRVPLTYGLSALITFAPEIDGGSTFETTDTSLQEALEAHAKYGKLFTLKGSTSSDKSVTYPKVQYYDKEGDDGNVVKSVPQNFTEQERQQARDNIGASASPEDSGSDGQLLSLQGGEPAWVDAPEGTVIIDSAMSDVSTHAVQNKVIKGYVDNVIYDISAANSGASYASLSAAIGTNGSNIPAAKRRGGMSIKFVQSSDNKYYQFRFMLSGSFTAGQFANPANWQGNVLIPITFSSGSIHVDGDNIGEPYSNTRRCYYIFDSVNPEDYIYFSIKSGYKAMIMDWDGTSSEMQKTVWLTGNGAYKAINTNLYILVGKSDDAIITAGEANSNASVAFSPLLRTAFKGLEKEINDKQTEIALLSAALSATKNEINKDTNTDWVQGAAVTSGEHIGEITLNVNIRCTKLFDNTPVGTNIAFYAKDGYKITFQEWDGESSAFNKITPFTSMRKYGVYTTEYSKVYVLVGRDNDANISKNAINDNIQLSFTELLPATNGALKGLIDYVFYEEQYTNSYTGEHVNPFAENDNKFRWETYKTIQNWPNSQSCAIYGDLLITALAMDEVESGANGHIWNIKTGAHVCDLNFGNTLNGLTYKMPHGNQICFGSKFYNSNSVFPLLYVSQTTLYDEGDTSEDVGELGVLVYDIQKVSNTEYTPVLVQAIIPDLTDQTFRNKISKWTTNYVVDTFQDLLYVFGYPRIWDWTDSGAHVIESLTGDYPMSVFKLPKLGDGAQVVLDESKLLYNTSVYRITGIQQILYYNGKIYIQGGVGGRGYRCLDVIDTFANKLTTRLMIPNTEEPQGLFPYDNKFLWYNTGTSGQIYKVTFKP